MTVNVGNNDQSIAGLRDGQHAQKEVQQSVAVMTQANSNEDDIARKSHHVQRQKVKKPMLPPKAGEIFKENLTTTIVVVVAQLLSHVKLLQPHVLQPTRLLFHGISQARILEWVAISFSRGSSQPRDPTQVSCIGRRTLYQLSHQGSPKSSSLAQTLRNIWIWMCWTKEREGWGSNHTMDYTVLWEALLNNVPGAGEHQCSSTGQKLQHPLE